MSDAELYKVLCGVAFETEDEKEIEQKYALSQRRGFKLSIVNFLEGKSKLDPFRLEAEADPKAFAEKYLQEKLVGDISVEHLPFGFVIYLDEEDYALFGSKEKTAKSIRSNGLALSWDSFPEGLRSKVILVNKGGKECGITTKEELAATRRHEVRHILFTEFHEQQSTVRIVGELSKCETEQDYNRLSKTLVQDFTERAKDEIIAYFSNGEFDENYFALRVHQYRLYVDEVKATLKYKKPDMPKGVKIKILDTFIKDRRKCFEMVRRIKFVAESMYRPDDEKKNDFVEALLRNTPGDKVHRLAKYTEFSEEDIKSDKILKVRDREVVNDLNDIPSQPERFDRDWWDRVLQIIRKIKKQVPFDALPSLLNKIIEWKEQKWGFYLTEEAILSVKDSVELLGFTDAEGEKIKEVMNSIISLKPKTREDKEDIKELKKVAKEVLALIKSP